MNSLNKTDDTDLYQNKNYMDLLNGIFSNITINSPLTRKKSFLDDQHNETFSKIKLTHKKENSYAEIMKKIKNMNELSHELKFDQKNRRRLHHAKEKIELQMQNSKKQKNNFNFKQMKSFNLPKIKLNPIKIMHETGKILLDKISNKDDEDKKICDNGIKESIQNNFLKPSARITNKSINSNRSDDIRNSTKFISNKSILTHSYDSIKFRTLKNDSRKQNLQLSNVSNRSNNSLNNHLSTELNTMKEKVSAYTTSEKNKRQEVISEDLIKKYALNQFADTVTQNFKKYDSMTKQMRKKISNILTSLEKQEKTHNSMLEITNKNFVFIYDTNTRVNIENDDLNRFKKKNIDYHAMNLNYFNAHRYGNIIKEKYNMIKLTSNEEISKLIRMEKHKHVEDMLEKADIKKKLLIKKIKTKNFKLGKIER